MAADLNFELGDENATSIVASGVTGISGFLVGAKGNYNVDEGKLDANTLAAAYCSPEFQVHGFLYASHPKFRHQSFANYSLSTFLFHNYYLAMT